MASGAKDVFIFCLDVGNGMQSSAVGLPSHLQKSIEILSMIIQRKIFSQSKDEMALILFGCDDTENDLFDGDNYKNISVVYSLQAANFDMLEYINNRIKSSMVETDFLDAITVSLDILFNNTKDNKKVKSRRIILFSNFDHESSEDSIEGIINGFSAENMNVELCVIGPSIAVDDYLNTEENGKPKDLNQPGPSSKMETLVCHSKSERIDNVTGKVKSQQQLAGENTIKKMLQSGVIGACHSYEDANQAVTGFEKRSVKSAAWKCHLAVGGKLSIPCVAYVKTKEAKLKQSWKKCHANSHKEEDVLQNKFYHKNDNDQTEVTKEHISKGYKYGKDIIPFGAEDEQQMKFVTDEKSLAVLGFTNQENVPPGLHMDDQAHYVFTETENTAVAFNALILAMQNQNLCAVARYVYRRGSNPKIVALTPHVRSNYRCLVMVALPFSEDIRPLSFSSLNNASGLPSAQQLSAVDKLIDDMDLSNEEFVDPKEILNPFFQYTYHCLLHRFLNNHADLPEHPMNNCSLSLPANIKDKFKPSLDGVKSAFKLQCSPVDTLSAKRWKNYDSSSTAEKSETADAPTTSYEPLVTIIGSTVENVGTVTPESDFLTILSNNEGNSEQIKTAFNQLRKRIEDFVKDPFVMKLSSKIVSGLQALIFSSENHNQIKNTNLFLIQVKNHLLERCIELWNILIQNNINLIGDENYDGNNRSNFQLSSKSILPQVYQDDTEEDADDLLDMID